MKKVFIRKGHFSKQIMIYTVSEELTNELKGKVCAPKKLEEANKMLRELKTPLPR